MCGIQDPYYREDWDFRIAGHNYLPNVNLGAEDQCLETDANGGHRVIYYVRLISTNGYPASSGTNPWIFEILKFQNNFWGFAPPNALSPYLNKDQDKPYTDECSCQRFYSHVSENNITNPGTGNGSANNNVITLNNVNIYSLLRYSGLVIRPESCNLNPPPTTTLRLGFAREAYQQAGISLKDPQEFDMQIVEGTITGNLSPPYDSVPDPVDNPALEFKKRLASGGTTKRLPCSEVGASRKTPATDWCADVKVDTNYTVLYRTKGVVDNPEDKCKSLGLLVVRENGTAEFFPYMCGSEILLDEIEIRGCPEADGYLEGVDTPSKSNCGVEILRVPATAYFPPLNDGPGGINNPGEINEINENNQQLLSIEYNALFVYKPRFDNIPYECLGECEVKCARDCYRLEVFINTNITGPVDVTYTDCCDEQVNDGVVTFTGIGNNNLTIITRCRKDNGNANVINLAYQVQQDNALILLRSVEDIINDIIISGNNTAFYKDGFTGPVQSDEASITITCAFEEIDEEIDCVETEPEYEPGDPSGS